MWLCDVQQKQLNEVKNNNKNHFCASYISVSLTLASDHLPFIEKYLFLHWQTNTNYGKTANM